ncbi:hypothetical protein GUJ93_ZPchr0165g33608 [Zizania palustris]|uniref:Uncharacterized protein n=1 Tax=Zizania palustris TaxID=103762 RepID=A0A8J5X3I2_ZIZPA|nr:hypothetical protein GUJ93_ZPchr0165g33608 [Zizania palustris]
MLAHNLKATRIDHEKQDKPQDFDLQGKEGGCLLTKAEAVLSETAMEEERLNIEEYTGTLHTRSNARFISSAKQPCGREMEALFDPQQDVVPADLEKMMHRRTFSEIELATDGGGSTGATWGRWRRDGCGAGTAASSGRRRKGGRGATAAARARASQREEKIHSWAGVG